jgi:hypothetical protein
MAVAGTVVGLAASVFGAQSTLTASFHSPEFASSIRHLTAQSDVTSLKGCEILHLALLSVALCPFGQGLIGLQKAGTNSPQSLPRLISLARRCLVAGHLQRIRRW